MHDVLMALTRAVPSSITECELTHLDRVPIDVMRAAEQHADYEAALAAAGCRVERLPPADEHPDAVFVEDAAIVFGELAVIARPGAASRRGETASVAGAMSSYRPLAFIEAPGTLDGGDVLTVGRRVFVGLSSRTNADAAAQLQRLLAPHGYAVDTIETAACLHLKSAATAVDDDLLLVNPDWIDIRRFGGLSIMEIHPDEPHAANVLRIGDRVLCSAAFPLTQATLETNGFATVPLDVSELAKAEAGLTCCSLVFEIAVR